MSCYFIAQIKINDAEEYQKYLDRSSEAFKDYRGVYLAVDDEPKVMEGNWDYLLRTVQVNLPATTGIVNQLR